MCVLRYNALGSFVALVKLWLNKASSGVKCGGDGCLDTFLDRGFLPPRSLWMIAAVCGVDENCNLHI